MDTKHTAGPWTLGPQRGSWRPISGDGWSGLAHVFVETDNRPDDEGAANARLIAASPTLLAACEAFVAWDLDEHPDEFHGGRLETIARDIHAAVAEATGQEVA